MEKNIEVEENLLKTQRYQAQAEIDFVKRALLLKLQDIQGMTVNMHDEVRFEDLYAGAAPELAIKANEAVLLYARLKYATDWLKTVKELLGEKEEEK